MYKIYCDGRVLHDPASPKLLLFAASLSEALNSAGTLTFKIAPQHPYYNSIHQRLSVIEIKQHGRWRWSGFPVAESTDMQNIKTVTVQGALAYLAESVQPFAEYHDTPVRGYLELLIANHNAQMDAHKRFTVGRVTVTDPNDSLYRKSNWEKTKDAISDKLVSRLGGYLSLRRVDGVQYIDYLEDFGRANLQGVAFGRNLLDLMRKTDGGDIANVIIPLGAKLADENGQQTEARLTIESINDGKNYVEDAESVARYGRIVDTAVFDDVTLPQNLLQRGYSTLAQRRLSAGSMQLTAVDLADLGANADSILVGDLIAVDSAPHGTHVRIIVAAKTTDLLDPQNSKISLDHTAATLTDKELHADKVVEKIHADYVKNEQLTGAVKNLNLAVQKNTSLIEQTASDIRLSVESEYTKFFDHSYVQAIIDGTAHAWTGEGAPTRHNLPALRWRRWKPLPQRLPFTLTAVEDDAVFAAHVGEIYTDTLTGKRYVWRQMADGFAWELLDENSYVVKTSNLEITAGKIQSSVTEINMELGRQQSSIVQLAGKIESKVEGGVFDTAVTQLASSISQKVSKGGEVVSELNLSEDTVTLSGNRVVIDSTYFKLYADGSLTATNGSFEGSVTATSGRIGGFLVSEGCIANGTDHINYLGYSGIHPPDPAVCVYIGTDGISFGGKAKITADGVAYLQEFICSGKFDGVSGVSGGSAGTVRARMDNASLKFAFEGVDKGGIYYGYKQIKGAHYVGVTMDADMAQVTTLHATQNLYFRNRYVQLDGSGYLYAMPE